MEFSTDSQDLTVERHGDVWAFSDGTTLPVVSGGDESAGQQGGGSQGGTATATSDSGSQNGNGGVGGGQGSDGGSEYSLGPGFLQRVPEEHRAILEPYVKQWDAGVTRRFQELHSQLSPYQELGDIEDLQAAMSLAQAIDENPWQVYGILAQQLQGMQPPVGTQIPQGQQQQVPQQTQIPQGQQEQGLSGQEGNLPPQVQQRMDQMQQMLVALAEHVLGQNQAQTEAQEDAELDQWLGSLHEEYGEFDDQWVLMRVYNGVPPEQAVNEFNQLIQARAQQQLQANGRVPNLLGGGGGASTGAENDVRKLTRNDTKSLVASVLAKANQAAQQ